MVAGGSGGGWRKGGWVLGQWGEVGGRLCLGYGGTIGILLGGVGSGGVGVQGSWGELVAGYKRLRSLFWLVWLPGLLVSPVHLSLSLGRSDANTCQNVSCSLFLSGIGIASLTFDTFCMFC